MVGVANRKEWFENVLDTVDKFSNQTATPLAAGPWRKNKYQLSLTTIAKIGQGCQTLVVGKKKQKQ